MTGDLFALQAQAAYANSQTTPEVNGNLSLRQARKVAQDFEAFYLSEMMRPMFANIEAAEPFGGGPGNEIWRSMQVDEIGKVMASTGGIGLADAVFQQILKMQEVQ